MADHGGRAAQVPVPHPQRVDLPRAPAAAEQRPAVPRDRHRRRAGDRPDPGHRAHRRAWPSGTRSSSTSRAIPAGQKIQLINRGVENAVDYDHTGKVMQFQVSGPATDTTQQHACPRCCSSRPVHPVMTLPPSQAKKKRQMRLKHDDVTNEWSIDDKTWEDVVDGRLHARLRQPAAGRRGDLGDRQPLGRLVPPAAHPLRRLPGAQPQRPAAAARGERPQGRRLHRGEPEDPASSCSSRSRAGRTAAT